MLPGSVLWTRVLAGSWLAQQGVAGTVPAQGSAYAATGGGIAVLGSGTSVSAFQLSSGRPRWQVSVAGVPAGSQIVGVRAFSGVVAVGVQPAGQGTVRHEVVLSAATGQQLRTYQASPYGGAVAADGYRTVIVGARGITAYANATGRVLWRRPTGRPAEAWRVTGQYLYVTEAGDGYLGSAPVTALRRISLRDGALKILRPGPPAFAGTLTGAVAGVVLFTDANGVSAYSGGNGDLLWHRAPAALDLADARTGTVYLAIRNTLTGVSPRTGAVISVAADSVSASLYTVNGGVALGLDEGALGEAWGYSPVRQRVVWTSHSLPWPHFFVDLSGLGGSASPATHIVLLATCAGVGASPAGTTAAVCAKPELVAILA